MTAQKLFEPIKMEDFELKNRIVLAPMTRGRAGTERVPNELMAECYSQRASAGLLITEATVVSPQGNGWVGSPGIVTEKMTKGWRIVTQKPKPTGTPIFLQLWPCGRASHADFHGEALPVSASAVKLNGNPIRTPFGNIDCETHGP
jgi:N-ethylmaleimide reductase